jgi:hypothetical protein
VISSALPVFAVEPTVAVPAIAVDGTSGASPAGSFADLLLDAQAASGDTEAQASAMVAPKMPKLAITEERQDEDVRQTEPSQDAPTEVAALAYALVTAIPMDPPVVQQISVVQGGNDAETPTLKVVSPKTVSVPVGQPSSKVSLDLSTPAHSEIAAVETQETPVSETSVTRGSLLHSRDSSQVLPLTGSESDLHEETPLHSEVPVSGPIREPTAMTMPKMSEPVALAEAPSKTEPVIVGDSMIRGEPLVAAVNDIKTNTTTNTAPIVLEARIVPKPKQDIRSESLSERPASPDIVAPKDSVTPVQDSVETNLETSEDDHESTPQEAPPQRGHTPVIRSEAFIAADSAPSRVSVPRPVGQEPARQPHVVLEEKLDATTQPIPLKHLDIRIPDANGGVTVRVHERAGGVQVSVRTSDAQIAGNIAETLPDLTRQLDHQGFHAETWTPSKETSLLSERAADLNPQPGASHAQHAHTEPAQEDNQARDNNRRPEWEEQPRRRPKPISIEDFKEHLS